MRRGSTGEGKSNMHLATRESVVWSSRDSHSRVTGSPADALDGPGLKKRTAFSFSLHFGKLSIWLIDPCRTPPLHLPENEFVAQKTGCQLLVCLLNGRFSCCGYMQWLVANRMHRKRVAIQGNSRSGFSSSLAEADSPSPAPLHSKKC